MIIRRRDEVKGTERHVFGATGTWDSQRYILADDGVGFSFHVTTLYKDTDIPLWYKNHVESVYVISGELVVAWGEGDIEGYGDAQLLRAGDMYLLDKHDRHSLLPLEDTTVACVFNPPVTGTEDHDADGSYELSSEVDTVSIHRERHKELLRVEAEYYKGYRHVT